MVVSPGDTILELVTALRGLISHIQWLLGGFFGLYLLYYVVSSFYQRKTMKIVTEIRDELKELNSVLRKR